MTNLLTKILGDKKEWNAIQARANALPRGYRIVYGEMKSYMWKTTTGDGMGTIAALRRCSGSSDQRGPRHERPGRHRRGRRSVLPRPLARQVLVVPGQVA